MVNYLFLVPGLPLLGAAFLLLFRRRLQTIAGYVASITVGSAFLVALTAFAELLNRDPGQRIIHTGSYDWISAGGLNVDLSFTVDPLSAVMLLVVTGVGTLIHIYSIGYMEHDDRRGTFFGYLNLFVASMLILVMANNFLVLYMGWELVGLCSYLLIAFWYHRPAAAAAGKKAFIVNRIGDLGFLIGVLLIYSHFGTLDFDTVFGSVETAGLVGRIATAIPVFLFIGAVGKSAQIPLHIWLPDAMEGPTPVSALIHAATMVTAGVYMVARAHVLFEASHIAATLVATIGVATALFAAIIAIAQDDIKRVLAYSTISQLGYMFLAVGVGALTGSAIAYAAGIFHLVTHAFFKALLFLGAGSVMHATGDEVDMKKMGGLLRHLPITGWTFIIGWLAIMGIPPMSGFFSKDSILAAAWEGGRGIFWVLGVLTAGLTAFYMSRQVFLTFFGRSRLAADVTPHESPPVMTTPLVTLAGLAALGGWFGLATQGGRIYEFLIPTFGEAAVEAESLAVAHVPEFLLAASVLIVTVFGGVLTAWMLYLRPGFEMRRQKVKGALGPLVRIVQNKFYVDEAYGAIAVWPAKQLARVTAFGFDMGVIDGAVNGVAGAVGAASGRLRRIQTGHARRYVIAILGGSVLLMSLFLFRSR